MDGIAGQPLKDVLYDAPAGLQDADFVKDLQLIGGDASGITVTVSPIPGQPDAYSVTFTPLEPGEYSLEVSTQGDTWTANYTVAVGLAGRVIAKGFKGDMFGKTDDELMAEVEEVVSYKTLDLRGEFGDAVVYSTDELLAAAVNRAIVELSAAEMWGRRKAYIMRTVAETGDARSRTGLTEENAARMANDEAAAAFRAIEAIGGLNTGFSFKAQTLPISGGE
jgi:hypothetical protein